MFYDAEALRIKLIEEELRKKGVDPLSLIPGTKEYHRVKHKIYYENNKKEINARQRKYNKKHKEEAAERMRAYKYNLTVEQYNELLNLQNNACALCFIPFTKDSPPLVDHDHIAEETRGLLCKGCNLRLCGVDDINWLERAIDYVLVYNDKHNRRFHKQLLEQGGPRAEEVEKGQEEDAKGVTHAN